MLYSLVLAMPGALWTRQRSGGCRASLDGLKKSILLLQDPGWWVPILMKPCQSVSSHELQVVPAADTAPLNIKKIRRRGLVSGVHLVLPPSPLPLASSNLAPPLHTSSTPGSALTFTAEWDLTHNTFVFTPFESDHPQSTDSPRFLLSPVPINVEDDPFARGTAPSTPSPYTPSSIRGIISPVPASAPIRHSWSEEVIIVTDETDMPDPSGSNTTASSAPSTPVSPIFDSPLSTKRYSHGRKSSQSTVASSVTDLSLPEAEKPPALPPKDDGALYAFEKELHCVVSPGIESGDFSEECYEGLDQDLLLAPMDVFERMLWEATLPERQRTRRKAKAKLHGTVQRRPPFDVPRNTPSSAFSLYSVDVSIHPYSCAVGSDVLPHV